MKRIATEPTPTDEQQVGWRRSRRPFRGEGRRATVPLGDYLGVLPARRSVGGSAEWATGGLQWPELP